VGSTASLDVEKRKFLTLPVIEIRPSVVQPVTSRYTDYAIPVPYVYLSLKQFRIILIYLCFIQQHYQKLTRPMQLFQMSRAIQHVDYLTNYGKLQRGKS
jgi:hypothetical protein